jgi:hypothetical protein
MLPEALKEINAAGREVSRVIEEEINPLFSLFLTTQLSPDRVPLAVMGEVRKGGWEPSCCPRIPRELIGGNEV